MAKYRLLITDITNYGDLRCIAGWDLDRDKMIRPEPTPAAFWPGVTVGRKAQFGRGAIVEFEGRAPNPSTDYPHRTEDRIVVGAVNRIQTLTTRDRQVILARTISSDLESLFDGNLLVENSRGFVPLGTACRSLGAIEIDPSAATVFEDSDWGKKRLRCRMRYGNRVIIPTITSTLVQETYRQGGIATILEKLDSARRLHLRIGLARAFAQRPNRCYIQVNDIYIIR